MDELSVDPTEDGVLLFTLYRPDALNAITPAMGDRYFNVLQEADADPATRVVPGFRRWWAYGGERFWGVGGCGGPQESVSGRGGCV